MPAATTVGESTSNSSKEAGAALTLSSSKEPLPTIVLAKSNQYSKGGVAACTPLSIRFIEECIVDRSASIDQVMDKVLNAEIPITNQHANPEDLIRKSKAVCNPDYMTFLDDRQFTTDQINLTLPPKLEDTRTLFDSKLDGMLFIARGITIGAIRRDGAWICFDPHGIEGDSFNSRRKGEIFAYAAPCRTSEQLFNYLQKRFPAYEGRESIQESTLSICPLVVSKNNES